MIADASASTCPPPAELPQEPAFAAPWQAQAFAMAVKLMDDGRITRTEWAETLGAALRAAPQDDYWIAWLDALERLVIAKGLAAGDEIHAYEHAVGHAAARTPHGRPIVLEPADFA